MIIYVRVLLLSPEEFAYIVVKLINCRARMAGGAIELRGTHPAHLGPATAFCDVRACIFVHTRMRSWQIECADRLPTILPRQNGIGMSTAEWRIPCVHPGTVNKQSVNKQASIYVSYHSMHAATYVAEHACSAAQHI